MNVLGTHWYEDKNPIPVLKRNTKDEDKKFFSKIYALLMSSEQTTIKHTSHTITP